MSGEIISELILGIIQLFCAAFCMPSSFGRDYTEKLTSLKSDPSKSTSSYSADGQLKWNQKPSYNYHDYDKERKWDNYQWDKSEAKLIL